MGKLSKFEKLKRKASKNGWVVPVNNVFEDKTWMAYWEQMEEYNKDKSKGRPIAPHRTGGARIVR